MKIEFKNGFKFIAKKNTWFVGEVTLDTDCTDWNDSMVIEKGWGIFEGWTYESYKGYNGDLPRQDGESCSFNEFDIYYDDKLIEDFTTYGELKAIVRESRIEGILKD